MKRLLVKDYIETAFSMEDAERLSGVLNEIINDDAAKNDGIEIDFQGIRYFTTLFFNNAIVNYIGVLGVDDYSRLILLKNLSDVGRSTYQHSLDNAKEFYAMTEGQQKEFEGVLKDTVSDFLED